jgi:hypothetical protein
MNGNLKYKTTPQPMYKDDNYWLGIKEYAPKFDKTGINQGPYSFMFGGSRVNADGETEIRPRAQKIINAKTENPFTITEILEHIKKNKKVNPKLRIKIQNLQNKPTGLFSKEELAMTGGKYTEIMRDNAVFDRLSKEYTVKDIRKNIFGNFGPSLVQEMKDIAALPLETVQVLNNTMFGFLPGVPNFINMSEEEKIRRYPAYMGVAQLMSEVATAPTMMGKSKEERIKQFPAIHALMDYYGTRYGSLEEFKRYVGEEPAQALGDFATLLTPWTKFTKLGKSASASAGALKKAAGAAIRAEKVADTATPRVMGATYLTTQGKRALAGLIENASPDVAEWALRNMGSGAVGVVGEVTKGGAWVGRHMVLNKLLQLPMVPVEKLLAEYNPTIMQTLKGDASPDVVNAMFLKGITDTHGQRESQWNLDREKIGDLRDSQGKPKDFGYILDDLIKFTKEALGSGELESIGGTGLGIAYEVTEQNLARPGVTATQSYGPIGGETSPLPERQPKVVYDFEGNPIKKTTSPQPSLPGRATTRPQNYEHWAGSQKTPTIVTEKIEIDPNNKSGLPDYDRTQLIGYVNAIEELRNQAINASPEAWQRYQQTGVPYVTFDEMMNLKKRLTNLTNMSPLTKSISKVLYGNIKKRIDDPLIREISGYEALKTNYNEYSEVLEDAATAYGLTHAEAYKMEKAIPEKRGLLPEQEQLWTRIAAVYTGADAEKARQLNQNLNQFRQQRLSMQDINEIPMSGEPNVVTGERFKDVPPSPYYDPRLAEEYGDLRNIMDIEAIAAAAPFATKGDMPKLAGGASAQAFRVQQVGQAGAQGVDPAFFTMVTPMIGPKYIGEFLQLIGVAKDVRKDIITRMKDQKIGAYSDYREKWKQHDVDGIAKAIMRGVRKGTKELKEYQGYEPLTRGAETAAKGLVAAQSVTSDFGRGVRRGAARQRTALGERPTPQAQSAMQKLIDDIQREGRGYTGPTN